MDESTLIVKLPISNLELVALERLISAEDIFVAGNFKMPNLTATEEYIRTKHFRNKEVRILFDRNVISRLVNLAEGKSIVGNDENAKLTRYAAGCLAFCMIAEIEVEHSMALYEGAFTSSHEKAEKEHKLFLTINNTHPRYCTEIALGMSDSIPIEHLQEASSDLEIVSQTCSEPNLAKKLNLWQTNYVHMLKVAELRREHPNGTKAAIHYLEWQANESFYNAPASLFGLAAISPSPPKGGMFKRIRTANTAELYKNICNATWDICYITQWGRCIRDANAPHWLFGSHDIALRKMAKITFCEHQANESDLLTSFLQDCWGKNDGAKLATTYEKLKSNSQVGTLERKEKVKNYFLNIETHIDTLEEALGI